MTIPTLRIRMHSIKILLRLSKMENWHKISIEVPILMYQIILIPSETILIMLLTKITLISL